MPRDTTSSHTAHESTSRMLARQIDEWKANHDVASWPVMIGRVESVLHRSPSKSQVSDTLKTVRVFEHAVASASDTINRESSTILDSLVNTQGDSRDHAMFLRKTSEAEVNPLLKAYELYAKQLESIRERLEALGQ